MHVYPLNILESYPILIQSGQLKPVPSSSNHLIVYVHGFRGAPFDLRRWRNAIKIFFPKTISLLSQANQREGDEPIQ